VSQEFDNEASLLRAVELCTKINAQSAWMEFQHRSQKRLVVSFDVYCRLLEYTVYVRQAEGSAVHCFNDYVRFDDLVYEANGRQLDVRIDFFLSPESIRIE
jgi:hypothetical protein